jgi:hypothetical protein
LKTNQYLALIKARLDGNEGSLPGEALSFMVFSPFLPGFILRWGISPSLENYFAMTSAIDRILEICSSPKKGGEP